MVANVTAASPSGSQRIVVVGAGTIGTCMATVCSDNGFAVDLIEPDRQRRNSIAEEIRGRYAAMQTADLSRCTIDTALSRIKYHSALTEVEPRAQMVLEAGPEDLSVKQAIFDDLFSWASPDTVLATTSSALTISQIVENPDQRKNCLCAHSVNPPTIIRLVECVPSPQTDETAVEKALFILRSAGFVPVPLGREISGFAFNRLQGAMLREAYRLVSENVIDVEGLDLLVTEGLGPRWALSGPFETAELNTPGGIRGHASRMGSSYQLMGEQRGESDCHWDDDLVDEVDRQRRRILPLEFLPQRRIWREMALSQLMAARRSILQAWDNRAGTDKSI